MRTLILIASLSLLLAACKEEKYDNELGSFSASSMGDSHYTAGTNGMGSGAVNGDFRSASNGISVGKSGYGSPTKKRPQNTDDGGWFDGWFD